MPMLREKLKRPHREARVPRRQTGADSLVVSDEGVVMALERRGRDKWLHPRATVVSTGGSVSAINHKQYDIDKRAVLEAFPRTLSKPMRVRQVWMVCRSTEFEKDLKGNLYKV